MPLVDPLLSRDRARSIYGADPLSKVIQTPYGEVRTLINPPTRQQNKDAAMRIYGARTPPPAITPPAATPPAITPPAATGTAITPPAATPPAITPPAATGTAITPPAATTPRQRNEQTIQQWGWVKRPDGTWHHPESGHTATFTDDHKLVSQSGDATFDFDDYFSDPTWYHENPGKIKFNAKGELIIDPQPPPGAGPGSPPQRTPTGLPVPDPKSLPTPVRPPGTGGPLIPRAEPFEPISFQERLDAILRGDSALLRQAATRGRQYAQSRGLLNTSLAAQASQQAVLGEATKIAQADVQTDLSQRKLEMESRRIDQLAVLENRKLGLQEQALDLDESFRQKELKWKQKAENQRLSFDREMFETNAGYRDRQLSQVAVLEREKIDLEMERLGVDTTRMSQERKRDAYQLLAGADRNYAMTVSNIYNNPDMDDIGRTKALLRAARVHLSAQHLINDIFELGMDLTPLDGTAPAPAPAPDRPQPPDRPGTYPGDIEGNWIWDGTKWRSTL